MKPLPSRSKTLNASMSSSSVSVSSGPGHDAATRGFRDLATSHNFPRLLTETSPSLECSTSGSRGWARVRTHRRVRNSECFGRRRHLHLSGHQRQELGEVNGAVSIGVDLVDHVLQLGLRRVLAQRAHHGAQLLLASAAEANNPRNKKPAADSTSSSQTAKTC